MDPYVRYKEWLIARLRKLIKRRGYSVSRLERELGHSRGYVGDALRGQKDLNIELMVEVLDFFGVDPWDFFADRDRG